MVELWFYSGRIGNCMFAYTFNRCIADTLELKCSLPKGTEITGFPNIKHDSTGIDHHEGKYTIYNRYPENPRVKISDNDNMVWLMENQFRGGQIENYEQCLKISNVVTMPDIRSKYIVTLGNFETAEQYLPYRQKIKDWFKFPEIDWNKFEFFKLHTDLGNINYFTGVTFPGITDDDLLISLRLEDYTTEKNFDRLLLYDFFEIILKSRKWNHVYILTNPGYVQDGRVTAAQFIEICMTAAQSRSPQQAPT